MLWKSYYLLGLPPDQFGIWLHDVWIVFSGVARVFPGGRVAHPEGQNDEENK